MNVNIKTASIKAAIECAAKKDVRSYLVGVNVICGGGIVIVQSTDGSAAFQDQYESDKDAEVCNVIIPIDACKQIAKSKLFFQVMKKIGENEYRIGDVVFKAIDMKFPDVDRVMPERNNDGAPQAYYDAELLARCQTAMRIATEKKSAFFRVQNPVAHHVAALMHRETEKFPRCAIMPLIANKAFLNN